MTAATAAAATVSQELASFGQVPGRDAPRARPNGESSWETVAAAAAVAVAAVTWKFRLTFRPGNYI